MIRHSLATLGIFAVFGCCTPPEPETLDSITLEESACFGFCPVYSMTILSNDTYKLDAMDNTRTPGMSSGALPPGSWASAQAAITTADFFARPSDITPGNADACGMTVATDLPSATISVVDAEPFASSINFVEYYPGCFESPHKMAMDALVETLRETMSYSTLVAPAP